MDGYPQNRFANAAWCFRPAFWNKTSMRWEWAPEADPYDAFTSPTLTIISYNVWFDNTEVVKRMEALGDLISQYNPDLIALQEMTPYICGLLFNQRWVKKYFVSDISGAHLGHIVPGHENAFRYGNILLSKVNFSELCLRDFPSGQQRKALFGSVRTSTGNLLTFGTFHLESYPRNNKLRKQQMELFFSITSPSACTILVGDSNMETEKENKVLPDHFSDGWLTLYPGIKGYTYPSDCANRRYDRLFFTKATLIPKSCELVGTKNVLGTKTPPSDHLGMVWIFDTSTQQS